MNPVRRRLSPSRIPALLFLLVLHPLRAHYAPHLVVISVDGLRAGDLGCLGSPGNPTPGIDLMARDGFCLEQCRTTLPVGHALLWPLLTGGYSQPAAPPSPLPPTLASVVRERNYTTLFVGSWPGPSPPAACGFERSTTDISTVADCVRANARKRFFILVSAGRDRLPEIDRLVQQLLGLLDELKQKERTLVWLTGGTSAGKSPLPLIVHWTGHVPTGARSAGPVSPDDLLPTMASLCGVELPADPRRSSADLSSWLQEPRGSPPRP